MIGQPSLLLGPTTCSSWASSLPGTAAQPALSRASLLSQIQRLILLVNVPGVAGLATLETKWDSWTVMSHLMNTSQKERFVSLKTLDNNLTLRTKSKKFHKVVVAGKIGYFAKRTFADVL
jgi:hypothetical protein